MTNEANVLPKQPLKTIEAPVRFAAPKQPEASDHTWYLVGCRANPFFSETPLGGVGFPAFTGFASVSVGDEAEDNRAVMPTVPWQQGAIGAGAIVPLTKLQLERIRFEADRKFIRPGFPQCQEINLIPQFEIETLRKVIEDPDYKADPANSFEWRLVAQFRMMGKDKLLEAQGTAAAILQVEYVRPGDISVAALVYAMELPKDIPIDPRGEFLRWRPYGAICWKNDTLPRPLRDLSAEEKKSILDYTTVCKRNRDTDGELTDRSIDGLDPLPSDRDKLPHHITVPWPTWTDFRWRTSI
jgi:hypothetical protein